jgi:hypothetical protein
MGLGRLGPRVITDETRERMKTILTEIQSGQFAREWIAENEAGKPLRRLVKADGEHPIEIVGAKPARAHGLAARPQIRSRLNHDPPPPPRIPEPAAAPKSGARLLVSTLERLGVEVVFGYPGGAIMPIYDALAGSSLRHILVRHEQGAAFAADAYARAAARSGSAWPPRARARPIWSPASPMR